MGLPLNPPEMMDLSEYLLHCTQEPQIPRWANLPLITVTTTFALLVADYPDTLVDLPLSYRDNLPGIPESLSRIIPFLCENHEKEELFHAIQLRPSTTIEIPIDFLDRINSVQVSENKFKKLLPPQYIGGMNYADRYWKLEKVPEYIRATTVNPKNNNRNPVRPKDLHEVAGIKVPRPRYKPSFWDLIFVLLQPSLELGKKGSLLLPSDLYGYQIEGVKFLMSNTHALLADDMGTGKTVMTIVALKLLLRSNQINKVLILCPPSVLYEWKDHIAEWAPELVACLVRGTQEIRSFEWSIQSHVYLTSYDTLRSDIENGLLPKEKWGAFDVVVVDEAHHIKNSETDRSRAIRKLQPKYRWALTGTPVQNKIEDMTAIFTFLYPHYLDQTLPYEDAIKQKVAPYFLRRRKMDVLKDLPPKLKQDIWLEMSDEQRREYNRVENEIVSEIEGMKQRVTKQHIFAKMHLLKQVCNFPSNKRTSPKLDALKDQVEDVSMSGNKVIVFTQYIEQGVDKLASSLQAYGVAKIVGGQSDSFRKAEIEKFKNTSTTSVLVASVKSGGEGLNLTQASYVIHFDHWWNPAVMWQAEDRAHRKGQLKSVNVYSYWMKDTIDERIYNILKKKGLLIQNVVDGLSEDVIDQDISLDDLFEIIGVKKPLKETPQFDSKVWRGLSIEEIHRRLYEIPAGEFELLIEHLMHYLGYPNVRVTKKSHDGGVDVISTRIGEKGTERVAAQCKRYKQPIGIKIAREFLGAIQDDKTIVKGFLVTTSEFSSECISFCLRHGIEMIPGPKIAEYVKQFSLEFQ